VTAVAIWPFLSNLAQNLWIRRAEVLFADFCPNPPNESLDSLRAPRTQPIFVDFGPYRRDFLATVS
jgi:hypothetical protein